MEDNKTPHDTFRHKYTNFNYKFCCGLPRLCKTIKERVLLAPTHQNGLCIRAYVLGLP
jgi:hypothetical protein